MFDDSGFDHNGIYIDFQRGRDAVMSGNRVHGAGWSWWTGVVMTIDVIAIRPLGASVMAAIDP
jgi:hypothetical protein